MTTPSKEGDRVEVGAENCVGLFSSVVCFKDQRASSTGWMAAFYLFCLLALFWPCCGSLDFFFSFGLTAPVVSSF
jgi:hypothetical protein